MKKVTIICCAYNRPVQAVLIAYCFLAQTYPNLNSWKIINNGLLSISAQTVTGF
jgi:hypothetical protein